MLWFINCKDEILLKRKDNDTWCIPCSEESPVKNIRRCQPLPAINGQECMGVAVETPVTNCEGMQMFPLRQTFFMLPHEEYIMAGKAVELTYFEQQTRFCGVCGAPMRWDTDISRKCTECGKEMWPLVATAIIVRVEKDNEILLVRAHNFRGDHYGLVAGFLETAETLEDCVRREVREETGLEITDIRYFGSQPWPYPSGLMVGFTARYSSGKLHLQHSELSSGGWFRSDNLPNIPDKASIARQLIDDWLTR